MINIYYLSYCPHSQNALKVLSNYNIEYNKIESSDIKTERKTHYPTFPQIYWHDTILGGNSELVNIIDQLKSCNIPENPDNWHKKKWYTFLIHIAEKI
jgi:glutaredoxin-related protein